MVQAGKSLRHPDLERNGAGSVAEIYDLVYNGKGKMPGYGTGCTARVLFTCLRVQQGFLEQNAVMGGLLMR